MNQINKIINIILFIAYSVLAVWIGYHFGNKKTVSTAPSIVVFQGKPDSTKAIAKPLPIATVPVIRNAASHVSKPDSVKADTLRKFLSQPQLATVATVHPKPIEEYDSYKTFSDSLGDYAIKILAKSPADSVFLIVHHFAMKTIEASTDWKWYAAIGAAAVLILEFIGSRLFK
jgi:hypothetical protein